jgi:integrase
MPQHHEFMDGRLHVYRRENSSKWQCSAFLAGKNWRRSTGEDSISLAKDIALDWYLGLRGKKQNGELKHGKSFSDVANRFLREVDILTRGERSPTYVKQIREKLNLHILPFFGQKLVSEITSGLALDYRVHRATSRVDNSGNIKAPTRSTLHKEIVIIRQVLKTATRHGLLDHLPDLSAPYKISGKISHRGWFSPEEYKQLYTATRDRAKHPKKDRYRQESENLHDYVLFMGNTGLRPDETIRLELRDVAIVTDEATGERILEIEVRGKRGVGYCKSMPGAVLPFQRISQRKRLKSNDRIFGTVQRTMLNNILKETGLKVDRDGNRRTSYSLRHTYICQRLTEGADIYQIAKNCRTSVEMIEKYYASHIKNTLDAAAINVRKPKKRPKPSKK